MMQRINHMIPELLLEPNYRIIRHLLIQIVVLLITVNILWDEPGKIIPERMDAWFIYFLQIDLIIYINMFLLVPHLLIKGKTLYYLLALPVVIICTALGVGMLQEASIENSENTPSILGTISTLAAFGLFMIGLTTIQLFKYHLKNVRKISELENATTAIELANLRNQINPHFLFNMLNNANIMAGEDVEKSSYILTKLDDLLRYQVDEGLKKTVKLKDDIHFINDYLELEKIRRDNFVYNIQIEGNTAIEIPPLLFIPFVENAVKHNPENDSYVNIIFRVTGNSLYFECKNPKAKLLHVRKEGGIGLVNMKKRLELLFEKDYSLNLKDEKEVYTVILECKI